MSDVVLPRLNQTGANEWGDVEANDVAIREVVNGELDNGNLDGAAGITDANLASPNNSVYRLLLAAGQVLSQDAGAGTYPLTGFGREGGGGGVLSGQNVLIGVATTAGLTAPFFYFDDTDYAVSSKTQKLRLRAQIACNATKAAIKFTFGLYPLTVAGGADELKLSLGTVASGSTVEINEPAASTVAAAVGSDFTIPADGAYVLGVVTSATLTNNSAVLLSAQLQTRSV